MDGKKDTKKHKKRRNIIIYKNVKKNVAKINVIKNALNGYIALVNDENRCERSWHTLKLIDVDLRDKQSNIKKKNP